VQKKILNAIIVLRQTDSAHLDVKVEEIYSCSGRRKHRAVCKLLEKVKYAYSD
jgi:hypothetical protein